MANVFGGGSNSSGSCGTNREIMQAPRQQVVPARSVSSTPNVFNGEVASSGNLSLRDFYTKREIDKYLDTKAEISETYDRDVLYTRSEVEGLISNLSLSSYALTTYVDAELADQLSSINNNLAQNYYTQSVLYTRTQVDSLISALSVTGDYISKTPATVAEVMLVEVNFIIMTLTFWTFNTSSRLFLNTGFKVKGKRVGKILSRAKKTCNSSSIGHETLTLTPFIYLLY